MYHIFFSADEAYIKYTAVLITSIVSNLRDDSSYEKAPICFHILSNDVSDETGEKLARLESELCKFYFVRILVHILDDVDFATLPKSGAAKKNNLSYYRLKMLQFLPPEVRTCLYLDSDMLCRTDIRELFSIDLENFAVGAVGDPGSKRRKIKFTKDGQKYIKRFDDGYFNTGFLLINVSEYKALEVESRAAALGVSCFYIKAADQDLLNATIPKNKVKKLDFSWNFNNITLCYTICKDEKKGRLNYTRKEFNQSLKNPKIMHFGEKPWKFLRSHLDYEGRNVNELWWEVAQKTPVFSAELLKAKAGIKEHLLYAGLGARLYELCQGWNLSGIATLIKDESGDEGLMARAEGLNDELFGLFILLGEMILFARADKKGAFSVFLKAKKIILAHKKYAHRAKRL